MKESIGNGLIMTLVVTFITLLILFFSASFAYTKAFRCKSRIVNIIEKYGEYNADAKAEIENVLGEVGYRVRHNESYNCKTNGRFESARPLTVQGNTNYHYCVYVYDKTEKGQYYAVVTYMYFEIPLIGRTLSFPVYGETKTMGLLG